MPKTAPAPARAALFNTDSEDEDEVPVKKRKKVGALKQNPPPPQQVDAANLNSGLRILDTDSEGEDDAVEAIKTRVCHSLYARHILTVASQIRKRQINILVRFLQVSELQLTYTSFQEPVDDAEDDFTPVPAPESTAIETHNGLVDECDEILAAELAMDPTANEASIYRVQLATD